jgi:hypothetical protein
MPCAVIAPKHWLTYGASKIDPASLWVSNSPMSYTVIGLYDEAIAAA